MPNVAKKSQVRLFLGEAELHVCDDEKTNEGETLFLWALSYSFYNKTTKEALLTSLL